MAALERDAEGRTGATWVLPDWEEYSEAAGSSSAGDWSDVEADVSLDTASSVASTEHQRVYRVQRARGGFPEDKQRDLRGLHSLYTRRRLEEGSQGAPSVRTSANWFQPAHCVSPRVQKQTPLSPVGRQGEKQVQSELLAQQNEISSELQAVRQQLSDFQEKWKKTVEERAASAETSGTPTVASSWSPQIPTREEKKAAEQMVAVQTESDGREDAVRQWLELLTQKLEMLASKYTHEPTLHFQAAMTHLGGLQGSDGELKGAQAPSNNEAEVTDGAPSLSSWHVGLALKTCVPVVVAEQFLELEHAVACMSAAVEEHERRQMTNFDRAIQQVQGFQHERMQRVVDESLAELKLVRGRYKKKEAQLEEDLRAANKEVGQWKQTAAEAEHRKKLDREALEFQLSAVKEQHGHACRRYEDDVAQLKTQLEAVRAERKQVVNQHRDTHEVIAQAKEGAIALERQCQALKKQQERTKELHDRETRVLQDTIRQLREGNGEMEAAHKKEKQVLANALEKMKASQRELEERVRTDIEQQMMHELLPEKMTALEKRHEEAISAIRSEHERQLAELAAKLDETKRAVPPTVQAMETQTDPLTAEGDGTMENTQVKGNNQAHAQTKELSRRCRALEKLLDKKFEDTPISSSRQCASWHSDDGISISSDLSASRSSSLHSHSSFRSHASGKSRALARALLGSARASLNTESLENKAPPSMNETTLATDEDTLGAHEMWDSASFTSIDTTDDLSSFASKRTTPRQRMRSTQEILTLVRQVKHAASSPLVVRRDGREPDPEVSWETLKQTPTTPTNPPPSVKKPGRFATTKSAAASASVTPGAFDDLLC